MGVQLKKDAAICTRKGIVSLAGRAPCPRVAPKLLAWAGNSPFISCIALPWAWCPHYCSRVNFATSGRATFSIFINAQFYCRRGAILCACFCHPSSLTVQTKRRANKHLIFVQAEQDEPYCCCWCGPKPWKDEPGLVRLRVTQTSSVPQPSPFSLE